MCRSRGRGKKRILLICEGARARLRLAVRRRYYFFHSKRELEVLEPVSVKNGPRAHLGIGRAVLARAYVTACESACAMLPCLMRSKQVLQDNVSLKHIATGHILSCKVFIAVNFDSVCSKLGGNE